MQSRIPSLNWLRVFEAAARTESFARAAEQLNMSAAAVSQQVRALEERLGAPLFIRHAHAVRLTEAGRAYLPPVQQALMTLEEATEGLFGQTREQGLYVQSVLIFAHGILSRGMAEFEEQHPGVSVVLSTGNSASDLQGGFSDLKIIFGNPHAYGAESDRLMGERLFPVTVRNVAERIAHPSDLLEWPLIEVGTHRSGWSQFLEDRKVRPGGRRIVYADSSLMAMAMAREGRGIALARAPASDIEMNGMGLTPCLPGVSVQGSEAYHLVYDSLSGLRPPARRFRDWLLDWIARQGWD
ncbi:LysR family transcriptional regulator [Shimia abyssi]|uniref:LysR family glycine cleavage system transcriptional activator n=1 Tax=Shimia abyssi TaxID=1662395 RepID=A0A2P8FH02_9RHOB|nr:LysR family transcriptional regulator [Shimia abyssi]PSL21012.1 LysR family glycine cleavage system transcriptional activator [Shimia abyssi]